MFNFCFVYFVVFIVARIYFYSMEKHMLLAISVHLQETVKSSHLVQKFSHLQHEWMALLQHDLHSHPLPSKQATKHTHIFYFLYKLTPFSK
jgi:hypothetical protein